MISNGQVQQCEMAVNFCTSQVESLNVWTQRQPKTWSAQSLQGDKGPETRRLFMSVCCVISGKIMYRGRNNTDFS